MELGSGGCRQLLECNEAEQYRLSLGWRLRSNARQQCSASLCATNCHMMDPRSLQSPCKLLNSPAEIQRDGVSRVEQSCGTQQAGHGSGGPRSNKQLQTNEWGQCHTAGHAAFHHALHNAGRASCATRHATRWKLDTASTNIKV